MPQIFRSPTSTSLGQRMVARRPTHARNASATATAPTSESCGARVGGSGGRRLHAPNKASSPRRRPGGGHAARARTCDGSPFPPCPRRRPPRRDARPPSALNSRCPARGFGGRAGAEVRPGSLERREARAELGENLLLLLEA